ncbi:DUF4392 domain-containing protein [Treponema sp. TIM-1]|uniref:DUF4392 domain-containing protein n=1 Tax=Treponema sp. TIM-1 TaxID=2898417 RepID=UPI00397FDDF8
MTQQELTEYNLGKSLDSLMHLDPRGYGVCNILYHGAYKRAGMPLSVYGARHMITHIMPGSLVYIITGFVLHPYNRAETDGPPGALVLARALVRGFDAKPLLICPEEAAAAMGALLEVAGIPYRADVEELKHSPPGAAIHTFTKDPQKAASEAEKLLARGRPSYVIAIEAPGANEGGVYHNALGRDVSALEAKSDVLFAALQKAETPSLAIGDLGNECGMGALRDTLTRYVPYAAPGGCSCGCGGGIAASTSAEAVITATVSNWAAYGITAALGYLLGRPDLLHTPELEDRLLAVAAERGLVDMYGEAIPAVDGLNSTIIKSIITLMGECVTNARTHEEKCKTWFAKTIALGFFENPG